MKWACEPFEARSGSIFLRVLRESDVEGVASAIQDPGGWAARHWGNSDLEGTRKLLRTLLAAHEREENLPFVYFSEGEIAGITTFHSMIARRKTLEIGFTAVAPKFRRSSVNTIIKEILLTHAFEQLGAVRAELRVDSRNYTSQTAVLRLGAKFEGKIRHWAVREDGSSPIGMLYSIVLADWPEVKARLAALRAGRAAPVAYLGCELKGGRVTLALSRQQDAGEFLELSIRNRASLAESFPQLGKMAELDEMRAYIAERAHSASAGTGFHYLAREHQGGALIGHVQVKSVNWESRSAELGYLLSAEFRGLGLAQEMLRLVLAELEEKHALERITVRVLPENSESLALARRLGFREEGVLRSEHLNAQGKRRDVILLSLLGRRNQEAEDCPQSRQVAVRGAPEQSLPGKLPQ